MNTVETAIVVTAYCIQYGVWVLLASAAVGLLISGIDWFLERLE